MVELRNMCKLLIRKPGGKRQLGRPECGWEDVSGC
jgi:hypothetical protein